MSKYFYSLVILASLAVTITCRSTGPKPKPVVIQALFPQIVHETRHPVNNLPPSDGEGRSRQYYRFPESNNVQRSPERGQILHRPNKNRESEFQNSPNMPQMNEGMPHNNMPMIINSKGKAKNVKYIPTGGFQSQQGQGNSNRAPPPQVYVISGGGDDEEDHGMMGSMQTYFKSIPRRIKEAVQGLMGTVD